MSPGTVKEITSKYLSLTSITFAALSSPTPCSLLPLTNLCANACSCRPGENIFFLPWRSMQRKASVAGPLKLSGKRLRNTCFLCFLIFFPNPLPRFCERKIPESQGQLTCHCSISKNPIHSHWKWEWCELGFVAQSFMPLNTNARGGMRRKSKEEDAKRSREETHRSCQFLGQAQRNQEQPQSEMGGRVSNMGYLRLQGPASVHRPQPVFAVCPHFSAMTEVQI